MANHCQNRVVVQGERAALDRFKSRLATLQLGESPTFLADGPCLQGFFEAFHPPPQGLSAEAVAAWVKTHWGTAREAMVHPDEIEVGETQVELLLDTAWTPPLAFFRALSKQQQLDVRIEFIEVGEGFCGQAHYREGNVLAEEVLQEIPRETYEQWGFDPDEYLAG